MKRIIFLLLTILFAPLPAFAANIVASPGSPLFGPFGLSKCGDTITLPKGYYPPTSLYGLKYDKASCVVRVTLDPEAVVESFAISGGAGGYSFSGGVWSAGASGKAIIVSGSHDITFSNITVSGSPGTVLSDSQIQALGNVGVSFLDGKNFVVQDSTFKQLSIGISHRRTSGARFSRNSCTYMNQDCIRGSSSNLLIEGNTCTKFFAGTQPDGNRMHFDCVQLWTADSVVPLQNIVVKNNYAFRSPAHTVTAPDGTVVTYRKSDTQTTIQIGDECDRYLGAGVWTAELKCGYRNLTIDGNVCAGGGQCINVEGGYDVKVINNYCTSTVDDTHYVATGKLNADGTKQLALVGIYPTIVLTRNRGGYSQNNTCPSKTSTYIPTTPLALSDDNVVPALAGRPESESTYLQLWQAGRKVVN